MTALELIEAKLKDEKNVYGHIVLTASETAVIAEVMPHGHWMRVCRRQVGVGRHELYFIHRQAQDFIAKRVASNLTQ